MKAEELIGQRESETVEFKAAEILRKPQSIAREVVGMLNSLRKSTIWIGVNEQHGVTTEVHSVEDVATAHARLRDHLVDTIEPRPSAVEVEVTIEPLDNGSSVLRVGVSGDRSHAPYAVLSQGGRHYWRRVQDRLAPMTQHELVSAWQRKLSAPRVDESAELRWIKEERKRIRASGRSVLWIAACAKEDLDWPHRGGEFKQILTGPNASNNRQHGWTFLRRGREPRVISNGWQIGDAETGELKVLKTGRLTWSLPLEQLQYERDRDKEFFPYALLEYPVSIVRLIAALLTKYQVAKDLEVAFELALFNVRGWTLWPYSPRSMDWHDDVMEKPALFDDADDLLLEPLVFSVDEITSHPDGCAFRAIRQIYEAFHFTEDKIPFEFSPKTHRLDLG